MVNRPGQGFAVLLCQPNQHRVVPFGCFSAEDHAGQNGSDGHRKYDRSEQSKGYGPGHWPEQTALDLLKRENRQISRDDDRNRVEYGPLDLMRGGSDSGGNRFLHMFLMAK